MEPLALPSNEPRYGIVAFEREFRIFELHSTNYSDARWMSESWGLPLYRSDGPAEDWYLVSNPTPQQYPERHPREGI